MTHFFRHTMTFSSIRLSYYIILSFLLFSSQLILAQAPPPSSDTGGGTPEKGSGKISGKVIDSDTQDPVPYATITLLDPATEKTLNGTVADEQGNFTLKNLDKGNYNVSISFIGYETIEKSAVTISDQEKNIDLGTISIGTEAKELDEVVVKGQRSLVTEKVDRTIYNAENDETTKGGDASDVLRRVPMLSVDLDGNVSLRGSQNIKVLIDNKPSTMTATSVGDALKQIPADQIASVEVITSPSARYDAEGTGGIINIVTKKNKLSGGSLGIDTSVGTRGSDIGLNGSYRRGKLGVSLGGHGRTGYNINGAYSNTQTTNNLDGTQTITTQDAETRTRMLFGRYNLGLDYDINDKNWISGSVQYGIFQFRVKQDSLFTQTYENNELLQDNARDVAMDNLGNVLDVSMNYVRTFSKKRQELSIMGLYSRESRQNNFTNTILNSDAATDYQQLKNINDSYNQEITLQADYTQPINDNHTLEFGVKDIVRNVSSDYQYYVAATDGEFELQSGDALNNVFNYQQNVMAGYVSYTLNLAKYSIMPGVRYEYTTIAANFQDEETVEIPSYGVVAPSINLSRKLENGDMIKAAFNRRIQRPSLQYLNPNLQASNPLNITQGNPDLAPEYTNNYELSYGTFIGNTSLNISTFMRNTQGAITSVRSVVGQDTILTTYENIGSANNYGASIFANVAISNKLSINGGFDTYYAVLKNNVSNQLYNANNSGWVLSGRMFGNYDFTDKWGLQFFGFYRGREIQLQGYQGGFGIYSLSVKREFKDDRGSIGFGAENFLTSEFKMRTEVNSPVISQSSVNTMRNMSFKINFSYRIGKLNADPKAKRRKRSIQNDDLKGGDGNGQQMSN